MNLLSSPLICCQWSMRLSVNSLRLGRSFDLNLGASKGHCLCFRSCRAERAGPVPPRNGPPPDIQFSENSEIPAAHHCDEFAWRRSAAYFTRFEFRRLSLAARAH